MVISAESLREVKDHFSEVVDRFEHLHDRVTATRQGRPAAVILGPDDLAQLEETLEILGDAEALADIREADAAYREGDIVRGIDAVKSLPREPRRGLQARPDPPVVRAIQHNLPYAVATAVVEFFTAL